MADQKISDLTAYTTPLDADLIPIVDTANTLTKKMTWANLKASVLKFVAVTAHTAMAVNSRYLINSTGTIQMTLPATAAVGDSVEVAGMGTGGWVILQNASQIIHALSNDTTTGVLGLIMSTHYRDSVKLVCTVANTEWTVVNSQGSILII